MNSLITNYVSHDIAYQHLKAKGASGWTSEDYQRTVIQPRIWQALSEMSIPAGARLLDLGCGTGDVAIWLAERGFEAYGIDIAPSEIAWAQKKASTRNVSVDFRIGNVVELKDYSDHFFQFVIDGLCLHCIIGQDRAAVLGSVHRVLQPGGGFFVQTMCGEVNDVSPMKPTFDPVSRCTVNERGVATRYVGKSEDILQEIQVAGFHIAHWEILPRESEEDQDDLLVRAIKRSQSSQLNL